MPLPCACRTLCCIRHSWRLPHGALGTFPPVPQEGRMGCFQAGTVFRPEVWGSVWLWVYRHGESPAPPASWQRGIIFGRLGLDPVFLRPPRAVEHVQLEVESSFPKQWCSFHPRTVLSGQGRAASRKRFLERATCWLCVLFLFGLALSYSPLQT